MKALIFIMVLFPASLLAESQYFYGENKGEVVECNSNYANCGQLQKSHDHRYDRDPRYDRNYRPYPRYYPPRYYNPYPYYQYQVGYICRNGAYYCGMNYPAPVGHSCYCNLISWGFWGIVTNY
ncbi:MAG: hypothetical protein MK008_07760 [Bdellovibrionales bacterium]|nr:hypothetical protein [Bdellovibrionales bacterium]